MDWDTIALGTDTSGTLGPRRYVVVRANNRTGPEVHHTANSRAAAARGTRPAAAGAAGDVAGVGDAAAVVSAAEADDGPVGRRVL